MERQCHHCNAAVPEGTPFCAACGAPQIRVVTPQSTLPPPLPESNLSLPPLPGAVVSSSPSGSAVRWSAAFKSCLIAAAAMTLALQLRIHPLLVLVVLPIGGWLAVYLYARGRFPVTAGIGARLGAVTGFIGFGISLALMGLKVLFNRGQFLEELKKGMQAAAAQNPDPQAQQIMQKLMSPEGVAVLITFFVVVLFFMFLVLCSVGGAIGGSMAKRKTAT